MLHLVLALALTAGADLRAAAAASGRPPECASTTGPRTSTVERPSALWTRTRHPVLTRYCDLVSRAQARLQSDPKRARAAARAGTALLPSHAAAWVVLARAALASGETGPALSYFDKALAREPHSVTGPLGLRDLGNAQWHGGKLEAALASYRTLALRAELLPTRDARALALLQAAQVAMTLAATPKRQAGPLLDEAASYLREAARDPETRYHLDVILSLVLVLDRAGASDRAGALLDEQRRRDRFDAGAARAYLVTPADAHALSALAAEQAAPDSAARHWRAYLASDAASGRFRQAAQRRLARLAAGHDRSRRHR